MKFFSIEGRDIPDTWFQLVDTCYQHGRDYKITKGSYEGQKRRELDLVHLHIRNPCTQPRETRIPTIPAQYGLPDPVPGGIGYIDEYASYILTDELKPNETYTYGSRLTGPIGHQLSQMGEVIRRYNLIVLENKSLYGSIDQRLVLDFSGESSGLCCADGCSCAAPYYVSSGPAISAILRKLPPVYSLRSPRLHFCQDHYLQYHELSTVNPEHFKIRRNFATNQLSMSVSQPSDIHLDHAPCLREIGTRIYEPHHEDGARLNFIMNFRCLAEETPLLYVCDGKLRSGTVGEMFMQWDAGRLIKVFGFDDVKQKPALCRVQDARMRVASDIMRIETESDVLEMTPEHFVYTHGIMLSVPVTGITQVRDLCEGTTLVRTLGVNVEEFRFGNDLLLVNNAVNSSAHGYEASDFPYDSTHFKPYKIGECFTDGNSQIPVEIKSNGTGRLLDIYLELSPYLGNILGAWLAVGWYTSSGVCIPVENDDHARVVRNCLKKFGAPFTEKHNTKDGIVLFEVRSHLLRDVLRYHGFDDCHKRVQPMVFSANPAFRKNVLYMWHTCVGRTDVSKDLAVDMCFLAQSVGVSFDMRAKDLALEAHGKAALDMLDDGDSWAPSGSHGYELVAADASCVGEHLRKNKIVSISKITRTGKVCDFTIEGCENIFVGRSGTLVHNSWDIWAGTPVNLCGLADAMDYMAGEIGVLPGELHAYSQGAHLYDHFWPFAKTRLGL